MGTEEPKTRVGKRHKILSGEPKECSFINPRVKSKLKLFCKEQIANMKLEDLLYDLGMVNMQIKDIASILKIKPVELEQMLKDGERDLADGIDTKERDMFVAYTTGKKTLEGNAVISMIKKSPDKLLEVINPDVYSDKVSDKYEVPAININISGDNKIDIEEMEQELMKNLNIKTEDDE